jgi:hypothetical protein
MIFRAMFWIGLVSLLAPHEPDLGLGRPGAGISLPATVKSWAVTGLSHPGILCGGAEGACAGGLGALTGAIDQHRLADMKLELDASIKARGAVGQIPDQARRNTNAINRFSQPLTALACRTGMARVETRCPSMADAPMDRIRTSGLEAARHWLTAD